MNADTLKVEIESLEKKRAQLVAALQQTEGALGFARHLLAKAEAAPSQVSPTPCETCDQPSD